MSENLLKTISIVGSAIVLSSLAQAATLPSAPMAMSPMMSSPSAADRKLIESAMAAAPANIANVATIIQMGTNGMPRVLKQGTNGFTCMPDNPATPGPDPMCMDKNALAWVMAWVNHKTPAPGKVGFMYMLAGGTDASNTDPYATSPSANNHWIKTGPHVMVVGAESSFYDMYPKLADPDTTTPYVMWSGSPYQHLMAPVK